MQAATSSGSGTGRRAAPAETAGAPEVEESGVPGPDMTIDR